MQIFYKFFQKVFGKHIFAECPPEDRRWVHLAHLGSSPGEIFKSC